MKYIRRYNNAKIREIPGWRIQGKKCEIELIDEDNGNAISIKFGRRPTIIVSKYGNDSFNGEVLRKTVKVYA